MINLFYNYDNDIPVEEIRPGENTDQFIIKDTKTKLLKNIKGDILGLRSVAESEVEAYFCIEAPEIETLWEFATFSCDLTDKADETVYSFDLEKYCPGIVKLHITDELQRGVYHIKVFMKIPHECEYAALINFDAADINVDLDFSSGDITIQRPLANQFYKTVNIARPESLKPENILKGVTIAGVTGTYDPLCKIEDITPGCTIEEAGNETIITVSNTELSFVEDLVEIKDDEEILIRPEGWWAGIKLSLRDEKFVKVAKYATVDPATNKHKIKSFDEFKDSALSIGLWGSYSDNFIDYLSPEKPFLRYRWWFDIDGDGIFEHTVTLILDIPTIRLIGHDPEYITFDVEPIDSEDVEQPVEDEEPKDINISIIYEDESQNENLEPIMDTYLIFSGDGALLSVE